MDNTLTKKPFLQGKFFLSLLILVFLLVPIFTRTFIQSIFILVVFYGFCAVAWNFICGYSGEMSLGHAVYLGIGGYCSTILLEQFHVSPWLGMLLGGVFAMIIGVIIGLPTFRLSGPYFALSSIAVCQLIGTFVRNTEAIGSIRLKGGSGFSLTASATGSNPAMFEFSSKLSYYYIALALLALGILLTYVMSRSKLGYYLVAIRSDEDAAKSLGINITWPRMAAMAISCFMMAIAGTFYAQYFRYIGPDTVFTNDYSIQIALIALVGGQGTVLGPLLGAIVVVPISEFLAAQFSGQVAGLNLFIYGVALMLVVFFMPRGICEYVTRWINKLEAKMFGGKKLKAPSKK